MNPMELNGWTEEEFEMEEDTFERLIQDEEGFGVIEIVLIIVVLIGLVAIFKEQITAYLGRIFESIDSLSEPLL